MIEILPESKGNLVAIRASGKLTAADYEWFLPRLEVLFREYGKLDVLFLADASFEGWDLEAAWDDVTVGLSHASDFRRLAIVGAPDWVVWCIRLSVFLFKGEVKVFAAGEEDAAWEWVRG